MNILKRSKGALDCLFIKCSGIGRLDDASGRAFNATLLVATWLWTAILSMLSVFSFWIFDLRDIYWKIWPYKSSNPKLAGLGIALIFGVPALLVAVRIGRECALRVKPKATWVESLIVGVWYMAVIMTMLLNLNKYGSLVGLVLHLAFFVWLMRECNLLDK